MVLHTDQLTLRPFEPDDWIAVHEYAVDPRVVEHHPWGPNTEAETRAFVRRAMKGLEERPQTEYEFAVTRTTTAVLIGGAGIRVTAPANQEGVIGHTLRRDD